MPACFSVILSFSHVFPYQFFYDFSMLIGINFFDRIVPGTSSAIASAKHPRDFQVEVNLRYFLHMEFLLRVNLDTIFCLKILGWIRDLVEDRHSRLVKKISSSSSWVSRQNPLSSRSHLLHTNF